MQSHYPEPSREPAEDFPRAVEEPMTKQAVTDEESNGNVAFAFATAFQGGMDMYSDPNTVADYLNAHEGWFRRCAEPMTAEPLGENGYVLTIGHFGAFGYEVEPKMGVVLAPPHDGIYDMYSIAVPDYDPPGYAVDYRAIMTLAAVEPPGLTWPVDPAIAPLLTKVEWHLSLKVMIDFPIFIHKLPQDLIQKTGDRLLTQIVRQISPRLTYTVQKDFHDRLGLPLPPKRSRQLIHTTPEST